jgi:NAD(P)-dependent dehydrogenase (short-subunit alcohol dehydrogenase family)
MVPIPYRRALIVGAGSGLSASLARLFAGHGLEVALAARRPEKLAALAAEVGGRAFGCDVAEAGEVTALFESVTATMGEVDVVVYNPSYRVRGPLVELDPAEVARTLAITAYGGFLVGQAAARRMLALGAGAILFTGASACVKGYPQSAPFAMGKFALRGLADSMARELGPQGIHVAHFVIDGAIRTPGRTEPADRPDSMLDPDAIAESYLHVLSQTRSAWTSELALRPWVEKF